MLRRAMGSRDHRWFKFNTRRNWRAPLMGRPYLEEWVPMHSETLSFNINHQVVGQITGDIVADLSDGLSIVSKLLSWCRSSASGVIQTPVPQAAINRYQQPMNWNVPCTGGWPCTTLAPFTSVQQAQSAADNWYGYQTHHNRGNTQILNSQYDQGNTVSFGKSGNSAQNSHYFQGELPTPAQSSPAFPVRQHFFGSRSQRKPFKLRKIKFGKEKISSSTPKAPVKLDHGHA
uniref:Uncharacterized protein n=1 Tax=Lygus hesperus TaxID=30085 RepID=A0A146LX09_LYGHE